MDLDHDRMRFGNLDVLHIFPARNSSVRTKMLVSHTQIAF